MEKEGLLRGFPKQPNGNSRSLLHQTRGLFQSSQLVEVPDIVFIVTERLEVCFGMLQAPDNKKTKQQSAKQHFGLSTLSMNFGVIPEPYPGRTHVYVYATIWVYNYIHVHICMNAM